MMLQLNESCYVLPLSLPISYKYTSLKPKLILAPSSDFGILDSNIVGVILKGKLIRVHGNLL